MKQDILLLKRLQISAIIGVLPHERTQKQTIIFDLEFILDVKKIAVSDSLLDAIDYSQIAKEIQTFIAETQFNLIETLAEKTAEFLLHQFKLSWLKLALYKPAALPNAEAVGVIIERP